MGQKKTFVRTPAQRKRIREAVKKSWARRKRRAAETGEPLRRDHAAAPQVEGNEAVMEQKARAISLAVSGPVKFTLSAGFLRKRASALRAEADACELLANEMQTSALVSLEALKED